MTIAATSSHPEMDLPGNERAPEQPTQSVNLTDLGDDALLELIGQHREDAFRLLIQRHIDRAYAVAYRILHNGPDAEDAVQDAFLKVWTQRGTWQAGKAKFSTWLFRVVTNRCIDLLRKSKVDVTDELPELEDDACDQSEELERTEAAEILEGAMGKLPDQQRIAIVLSYNESLSNPEIAEIMETTVSAVESLLKRGRQKLRDLLKSHSVEILALFTSG
ncbi:RNA polymerase sigma factor [Labrenzia sp. PHM005]|uniref:RNA polymerase sigma factor n=1 Tax=Labrenzia sp. PHM005 TaxID=2590016 RepID=UPI001140785B|nr:RNA polymerase sigma factor [Labrenzia sp. PHM005]QDG76084.1 RNA polymerase sigma factor [Labrenzia sp. PHM005]